ncbi:MAG TPA: hypothetical protein ENH35_02585, partial [Candidatus Moranbacteria bacterium]|nr:hypothetical protein [Candidatus Moranbacteria bacterium]
MARTSFNDLTEESKILKTTVPIYTPVTLSPDDETLSQIMERQEKFLKLSEPIKDKLASYKTGEKIQQIGKIFNLELLQMASIARAIRSYYFGEIKLEAIPSLLSKEIGIDIARAQEIAKVANEKIIGSKVQERSPEENLMKLPIGQALQKYPKTGEQPITSSPIKLKHFPAPARPSIKNWIADFHQKMGMEKHGMMERSEYLFNSENAKSLTSAERQKLAYI